MTASTGSNNNYDEIGDTIDYEYEPPAQRDIDSKGVYLLSHRRCPHVFKRAGVFVSRAYGEPRQ